MMISPTAREVLLALLVSISLPMLTLCGSFQLLSVAEQEKQHDMEVLHDFFLSTGGESWTYTNDDVPWDFTFSNSNTSGGNVMFASNPCSVNVSMASSSSSGTQYSTWAGITCSNSSVVCSAEDADTSLNCRISHLILPDHNLTGTLTSSLGTLSNLIELVLYDNQLSGNIPETLWQLTDLTRLDLEENSLTGELPSGVGALQSIERFYISFNMLTGTLPPDIGQLVTMERLFLTDNFFSGTLPAEMINMTNMNKIYFNDNMFDGPLPDWFESMTQLDALFLNQNHFTGSIPSSISSLTKLVYFSLSQTDVAGPIPVEMSEISSLAYLYLWETSVSGYLPPGLGELTRLQYFYCYSASLTGPLPDSYSKLATLRVLSFRSNSLTGTLPPDWATMSSLEYLFLYDNSLTGSIPAGWGDFALLQELHLHVNLLSGALPPALGSLIHLEFMYIYRNFFSGSMPAEIGGLTSLEQLFFSDNHLSGHLPPSLSRLVNLVVLDLSQNYLSKYIPSEMGSLPGVRYVLLGNNRLTGSVPSALGHLDQLIHLRLEANVLSGTLSPLFDSLTPSLQQLEMIDLSDNILSGTVPSKLFSLPGISVIVLSLNCFSGSLPSAMCSARNCTVISMDGLGAAFGCRDAFKLPITGVHVFNTLDGTFPNCLLALPELKVLHLTGNGLSGTLSDEIYTFTVSNMSLAHNAISGTIPDTFQTHDFDALDLSYNQLTGEYDDIGFSGQTATIVLEVNRLSGNFPKQNNADEDVSPHMDIINGNIFSCRSKDDYDRDVSSADYTCGSQALDLALMIFLSVVGVFCLGWLLVVATKDQESPTRRLHPLLSGTTEYWNYVRHLPPQLLVELPMLASIQELDSDIIIVAKIVVVLLAAILCLGVPIFILKITSDSFSTHSHQYRYLYSNAFTSGVAPAVCLVVVLAGLCLVLYYLRITFVPVPSTEVTKNLDSNVSNCESDSDISSPLYNIVHKVKVIMPFILSSAVVATINGFYVYSTLQAMSPFLHSVIEVCLALFNAAYNKMTLPILLKPIASRGKQIRSGFLVVIFNNVIVPLAASAFTSPKCFKGLLLEPEPLVSFYSFTVCNSYDLDFYGNRYCANSVSTYRSVPPVVSPYIYNYQCANAIIQSYIPIYVYMYTFRFIFVVVIAVVLPSMKYESVPKCLRGLLKTVLWPEVTTSYCTDDVLSYRDLAIHDILTPLLSGVTFGAVSPLLALVLTISTVYRLHAWRMIVGRFVRYQLGNSTSDAIRGGGSVIRSLGCARPNSTQRERLLYMLSLSYIPLETLMDECLWPLLISSAVFFSVLSWDFLGDSTGAWVALTAPLACCMIVLLLWLIQRMRCTSTRVKQSSTAVRIDGASNPIHNVAL